MRTVTLIVVLVSALVWLTGCASYRIGPRVGVDIPVNGVGTAGPVSDASTSPGIIYGATVEGLSAGSWGGRVDVQWRSMHTDVEAYHLFVKDTIAVETRSSLATTVQMLDIPMMVMFAPVDSSWTVQPFVGLGLTVSIPVSSAESVTAVHRITTAEGTKDVPATVYVYDPVDHSWKVSLLISTGCAYRPHPSIELRAEARINQLLSDGWATEVSYDWRTPGNEYYTHPSVSTFLPSLTMGLTLSALILF